MSEVQEPQLKPKKCGCFRGCIITVLVLALPFWWFCIHPAPLRISEETTYVLGPVTAAGYIDYFKALEERNYPPEMKTDENGYRLFIRQFGLIDPYLPSENYEFYRLQTYEKLGLDPDVSTTLTLPDLPVKIFTDFYEAKGEEIPERFFPVSEYSGRAKTVPGIFWQQPWTLEEYPMLADWVNEIDKPLDALAEAVSKPVFFMPLLDTPESVQSGVPTDMVEFRLWGIQALRTAAGLFQARAMYRIAHGDIDGAINDKLTLYRLGRQITQKTCVVQYLVGIAIEGMGSKIPVCGSAEHPPTKEQIQRVLDGLDALPPRGLLHDGYEFDRFMVLDILRRIRLGRDLRDYKILIPVGGDSDEHSKRKRDISDVFLRAYCDSCDWNVVYRRINELYDSLQKLPAEEFDTIIENLHRQNQWNFVFRAFTAKGRGYTLGNMLADTFVLAVVAINEAQRRTECTENLQRLTLALLLYEKEHGSLPEGDWREAVKPYLGDDAEKCFR
ncbi:MAG: DUF1559 domain-containing protein, partial [Planctomycetaceae bacterium]|nr:DUF1559 domain-containing protein [Planctomycetaceae bacterium]